MYKNQIPASSTECLIILAPTCINGSDKDCWTPFQIWQDYFGLELCYCFSSQSQQRLDSLVSLSILNYIHHFR